MRLLHVALKDLNQIVKDWKSGLFLLLMPLAFTLFFGFVSGGGYREQPVKAGWVDEDREIADSVPALGPALQELAAGTRGLRLTVLAGAREAEALVRGGKLAAAAVVPQGFSAAAWTDRPLPLQIIAEPSEPNGRVASALLRSAATRALGAAQSARLSLAPGNTAPWGSPPAGQTAPASRAAEALQRALDDWRQPLITLRAETFLPADRLTGFLQASPGMIVQFTIYGLITSAMILVLERKSRALQRLLTTTLSRAAIIAGHLAAMFAVIWLQEAVLVACGQFVFHAGYLHAPGATLVLMSALALWSSSLGLLIAALARTEQQVVMYSMIAMFLFSALGGAWFPLDVAGGAFARIGRLTPAAWAMEGFQNILMRGQGLAGVLRPAGLLAACGAAFFALAIWRFRFE